MNVRCLHCNHSFHHVVPSYARGSATAVCPSCGRDTPATEEWGLDSGAGGAVENRVYCFNCGRAMTPSEGELIPVCDDCRQEQKGQESVESAAPSASEPVADWMIRKANGNVYGPFPQSTIVEWIRARKINPDEEVAHIGGSWRLFSKHEEFARYFETRVEAVVVPSGSDLDFRRRNPLRDALRSSGRLVGGIGLVAALGLGVWYSIRHEMLVIPEATINTVAQRVENAAAGGTAPSENTLSAETSEVLDGLKAAHPTVTGSSTEHMLRGRTLMLRDNIPNLEKARIELEQAVVLDPSSALALAGLAEVYGHLARSGAGSLDLQRQSIYLLGQAAAQDTFTAEVLRGRASFLIHSRNREEGVKVAEQALLHAPKDAELHTLLGIATLGDGGEPTAASSEHFSKALELDPGFHQVFLEMARAEQRAGLLREAISHFEQKIARDPASAEANADLGLLFERLGDRSRAVAHYDKALATEPRTRIAALHRALIAMQLEGDAPRAVQLLLPFWGTDAPQLHIAERKEIGAALAAAYRLAGDSAKAIGVADIVLKDDRTYGPALLQRAMARASIGQASEALTDFGNAETPDFSPAEIARIHTYAGRAAVAAKRLPDAEDEFRKAIEADEGYLPAVIALAGVQLELGDPAGAAASLDGHLRPDPLDYTRVRDLSTVYDPVGDFMPVAEKLAEALSKAGFAPRIDAALGMVLFHAGHYDQAKKALRRATEEDDRNQAARFYSGLVEYQEGNFTAASAHFRALIDLTHDRGIFHAYLGDTLLELGRTDEAIECFQRAQQYSASGPWVQTRLAEALARKGSKDHARAELDKAVALDAGAVGPRKGRFDLNL